MKIDKTFGERVVATRRRRGRSQEVLAGLTGISTRYLQQIEAGRVPTLNVSLRIAEALGVKDLRDLTGQPFAVNADGRAVHPAVEPIMTALATRAAFLPMPSELPDLRRLEARLEQAWDAAQSPGPWRYRNAGALLPGIITDAEIAYQAHQGQPGEAHARRMLVMTHLLARPLLKWVGHQDLALIPAERAMHVAEAGDDAALLGAAAWNYALSFSTMQQPLVSQTISEGTIGLLAEQVARDDAPDTLLAAQGALHLVTAVNASRAGDAARSRHLLAGADTLAARIGHDTNHWRVAFGPTNVAIHRVTVSLEWGHDPLALAGAVGVMADRSPSVERSVAHRLDVAQAHSRQVEDDAALAALLEADRLSPEQVEHSPTARMITADLLRRDKKSRRTDLIPLARKLHLAA